MYMILSNAILFVISVTFPIKFNSLGDMKASITLSINVKKVFTIKNAEDSALADYIRFLVRYTSLVVGKRKILTEFKKNKDMNIFDVIGPSDEAFAVVLYENNRDKWESQAKKVIKLAEVEANEDFGENENNEPISSPTKKPKWTGMRPGKKNQYLQDNWSDDGKKRYYEIGKMIQACRVSGEVHDAHVEAWQIYNKRHKFVPIPKQKQDDTDDETSAATTLDSMPELKVPILKMVNGKFDFSNVFD